MARILGLGLRMYIPGMRVGCLGRRRVLRLGVSWSMPLGIPTDTWTTGVDTWWRLTGSHRRVPRHFRRGGAIISLPAHALMGAGSTRLATLAVLRLFLIIAWLLVDFIHCLIFLSLGFVTV